jgi:tetratricopeptide (TPR) repeat protein
MRRLPLVFLLLLGLLLARPILAEQPQAASSSLGRVDFPTTAPPEAQAHFLRGVAALHSFWYDEAADAFRAAQKAAPGFALAYWGEALTYDHPIWGERDLEAARQVLQRLAPKAAERAARAGNEKEKAWLAAVEALYGDGEKDARTRAYADALQKVHERWPDDLEAASFYALSLIGPALTAGGAPLGEPRERLLIRAAAILEEEFDRNPEHPGVVHYLIHAYDDPTHAPLGLRAARIYARVAPDAHHALHMPSHIFVQLGQWDRVAASNEEAWAASVAWTERRGLAVEKRDFHSLSWLAYAYLQQGRNGKARETLEIARREARASDDNPRVASSLAAMEARHLIETRAWDEAKLPAGTPPAAAEGSDKAHACHATGHGAWALTFAAGLAAGRRGDAAAAEEALARLRETPSGAYGSVAPILEKEVEGLVRLARGQEEEGLRLLGEAADAEVALAPPSGPPDLLKPALELYGEVLLERGRTEDALRQLERSLLRMPNRTASLAGAARAAARLGREEDARGYSQTLAEIWKQADDPQLRSSLPSSGLSSSSDE